ncbi:hypothetical protein PGQ11_007517 [Apiospora arundinis]|uniref:Uncharacterized protein n=1 Tax=Apiospora arundinis TaxID=335852 RepID=A0ABR2IVU1_9PEZI
MAIWPFRRKGSRKRPPGNGRPTGDAPGPPRAATEPATSSAPIDIATSSLDATGRRASKRQRQQQRGDLPDQHQWRGRTYSFSPGRRDSIRVARARASQQGPVPPMPAISKSATTLSDHDNYREQGPSNHITGHTLDSQNPEMDIRDRVPTLHHNNSHSKRSAQHLPRHKSSKRRKEDHDREAEVKAMSQLQPPPVRPATDSWTSGRPMKRDSKRARTGPARPWEQRDSDISLPGPESINSALSTDSDQIAWKLSSLDALAPRPTLRYSSNPLYGASSGSGPLRSMSQKRKLAERGPIPEATLKAHKRVDDLANDLDASDLRELMERDKRRRERKTERERERVEKRLARKSERQRAEEAKAARNGTPPPQNLERGVMGRDTVGLGIDTTSAVVTSSRQRRSEDSPRKREKAPVQLVDEPQNKRRSPSPLENFHRVDSIPLSPATPVAAPQTKEMEPANEMEPRTSRSSSPRLMGLIRPKKQRATSPTEDQQKSEVAEKASAPPSTRIASRSEESESGGQGSDGGSSSKPWSFFKWGRRNKRDSGPSSFSNTSRDSNLAQQPPQPINYMPRQIPSKVPKRTMSRFREDLPELPLSPPDSRVASPEAETVLTEPLPVIPDDVVMRYDTPTSGHRATPISMHRDEIMTSPPPQSMSLASIDSEGSWLSGGRAGNRKRASSGVQASLTSYPVGSPSRNSEEHDIDQHSIADDEFLKTVVDDKLRRKSTGEALPSSDDEDDMEQSPKWGNVKHTPTVMHHRDTMRSREGLLQTYEDDDKHVSVEKPSDDELSEGENLGVPQRATSVKVGGHLRNFSRGSAKLLEISPRPSGERRRSSNEPVTQ